MEQCSEMSAYKIQTQWNQPKDRIQPKLWWQLYNMSFPERDLRNKWTFYFCLTECIKLIRTGRLLIPESGEVSLLTLVVNRIFWLYFCSSEIMWLLVDATLFCFCQRTLVLLLELSFRLCCYKSFLNWMLGPTKTSAVISAIILVYAGVKSLLVNFQVMMFPLKCFICKKLYIVEVHI